MMLASTTNSRTEPPVEPQRSERAPIDLVHLTRQSFGDSTLEIEILRLFAVQTRIHMERLRNARSSSERDMAVHTMLGSSRGVGATALADALRRLRDGAGDADQVQLEAERAAAYAQSIVDG